MDFMTQIIFDSHILVLRVKKRDTATEKFHWVIHSSFEPPMDAGTESKSTLKTPIGTKATPPPAQTNLEKANTAVFITMKGRSEKITVDTFKSIFKNYLNEEHRNALGDVKDTNRPDLMIAYFDSWKTAKTISNAYKEKLGDHEVTFELFAPTNPNA